MEKLNWLIMFFIIVPSIGFYYLSKIHIENCKKIKDTVLTGNPLSDTSGIDKAIRKAKIMPFVAPILLFFGLSFFITTKSKDNVVKMNVVHSKNSTIIWNDKSEFFYQDKILKDSIYVYTDYYNVFGAKITSSIPQPKTK